MKKYKDPIERCIKLLDRIMEILRLQNKRISKLERLQAEKEFK